MPGVQSLAGCSRNLLIDWQVLVGWAAQITGQDIRSDTLQNNGRRLSTQYIHQKYCNLKQSVRSLHLEEVVEVIAIDPNKVPIFHLDITSI